MTQIGTEAYDPNLFCPPVLLTLSSTEVPEALADFTDGYRQDVVMTVARTV